LRINFQSSSEQVFFLFALFFDALSPLSSFPPLLSSFLHSFLHQRPQISSRKKTLALFSAAPLGLKSTENKQRHLSSQSEIFSFGSGPKLQLNETSFCFPSIFLHENMQTFTNFDDVFDDEC